MTYENAKAIVIAFFGKRKNKPHAYFNEMQKALGLKPREAKKFTNQKKRGTCLVFVFIFPNLNSSLLKQEIPNK